MKLLVVGDSYMPVEVFRRAFARLGDDQRFEYLQLDMARTDVAGSASEGRIREFAGSPRQIAERLSNHDALVVHGGAVTAEVLDAAPGLRLVCCARGGPVNVDVEAATARGIPVVTTPGKNAEAVADLTIAFLVILARGVVRAAGFLANGGRVGESTFEGAEWFGHDLGGHLLGLVGYGQVGRRVALRALAMGMAVASFDPFVAPAAMAADGVRPAEFGELLAEARFVSLHARQPASGPDLFGEPEFARMRHGSFFINTARETLVDEEALLAGAVVGPPGRRGARRAAPACGRGRSIRCSGSPTSWQLRTSAVRRSRPSTAARAMVAEEIERFAAGSAARKRGQPRPSWSDERAGDSRDRRGHRQLPRSRVRPQAGAQLGLGQREWAHAALPGVPGSQVFDTAARLAPDLRVRRARRSRRPASGRADVAGVSATSMREGMVLYDARGREIWACPNVDSPRRRGGRRARPASGAAERSTPRAATGSRSPRRPGSAGSSAPARTSSPRSPTSGMLGDWIVTGCAACSSPTRPRARAPGMFDLAGADWSDDVARR